jgi:hypothetical protein
LRAGLLVATLALLALAACSSETTTLSGEAIVSDIPWPPAGAHRLLDGDDEKGGGVPTIDSQGARRSVRRSRAKLQGRSRGRGGQRHDEPESVKR